jgi:WXG100 family type VII secretion target
MSQDIIQANYDQLALVARRFAQQAQAITELRGRVLRSGQALERGGWQGRGSLAFFAEMNGVVYPAMQRLIQALEEARSVTLQASDLMRRAEEEAAAVFKSQAAGSGGGGRAEQEDGWWGRWGEWLHGALDGLGLVPGVGELADGANALIYLAEGRHLEAGISAAAMIPIVGDVGKAGKYVVKAGKEVLEEAAEEGAERAAKEIVEVGGERTAREGVAREAGHEASSSAPSVKGSSKPEAGEALVGSSRRQMRDAAEKTIAADPDHPLRFLLDENGKFKKQSGLTHAELADRPDLVQMGHIQSKKAGGQERLMLQGAWENQFNNVTIESPHKGGVVLDQAAIEIGGIAVDLQTAKFWESIGFLKPGTVAAAPKIAP